MEPSVYQNQLPEGFTSWTHLYHSMRLWTPLAMSTVNGESGEMSFMISDRYPATNCDAKILLDTDFLKARLFEEIVENCEFEVDLANGYFGEVDHLIPWQIDHLNVWRPVAEKSCRSSFKIS